MTLHDLLGLVALPLGILAYLSLAATVTIGLLMTRRKARLPVHKTAARVTAAVATLHAASILLGIIL